MLVANVISLSFRKNSTGVTEANIIFYKGDYMGINPHGNNPLVITVQHGNMDIRHVVVIDPKSSGDIMFRDVS